MPVTKHYLQTVIGLYEPTPSRSATIAPKEFLSWAEKDLKSQDKRARGNALSNIKKALHARLDEIIARTHVRFASDWDPRRVTTDQKLDVIRKLGIKHGAVVALITAIRNDYEHRYIVPPLNVVNAYLSACELWVAQTYNMYDFHSVALVNLPITAIGTGVRKANGSVISITEFDEPIEVLFFWNSKKKLVTVQTDGGVKETQFKDFTTQEMLRLEAPLIKRLYTENSRAAFNQASLTDLFGRYRKWINQFSASSKNRA
jgi:hypothetical protein